MPDSNAKKTLPKPNVPKRPKFPVLSFEKVWGLIASRCDPVDMKVIRKGKHVAIILPRACNEINTFFNMGEQTPNNYLEAKAKLCGHRFIDPDGRYIFVVTKVMYIYPATREHTFVATSGSVESDFMEYRLRLELSYYNRYEKERNISKTGKEYDPFLDYGLSEFLGDIHSHPGFGAFFSARDKSGNESTAFCPNLYMVCDPIKEEIVAMAGTKGESAGVIEFTKKKPAVSNVKAMSDPLTSFIESCRKFLSMEDVSGNYRLYYDVGSNAHIKVHAKIRCDEESEIIFDELKG